MYYQRYQRKPEARRVARLMADAGFPIRWIARALGVSHRNVQYWSRADRWADRRGQVTKEDLKALIEILPVLNDLTLVAWNLALRTGGLPILLMRRRKGDKDKPFRLGAWERHMTALAILNRLSL